MIDRLRDDNEYYGAFGKQFMSNSNIYNLLNNPKMFGVEEPPSLPMLHGRYFHTAMLEPHKLKEFDVIDASTRSTKIYKDASGDDLVLLRHEKESLDLMVQTMKSNEEMYDEIYNDESVYEEPAIGELFGLKWKGKADIITPSCLIDIKTSSDIRKFKWSAFNYNYDSQAYIYSILFGKPLKFFVIDKGTLDMGIFECSDEFMIAGRNKVERAVEIYNRFFGDNPTDDINKWLIRELL